MRRILLSLALVSFGCIASLDAYCVNNATGKHKRIAKKRKARLSCTRKTREFYAQKNQKLAKRYYKKNGVCRFCGCSSAEHRNEAEPLDIAIRK